MVRLGKIIQGPGELYVSPEGFQKESKVKIHPDQCGHALPTFLYAPIQT